jgi:hypothetical protein
VASGIQPQDRDGGQIRRRCWSVFDLAVTPRNTDEAFLREVDEGVRRDQVASLWQRFGKLGMALLVLFLAALGGYLWWRENEVRKAGVAGEDFGQAIAKFEIGDTAAARPALGRLATQGPSGYRTLAGMMQAADAAGAGDNAKAIKLYDAIAGDASQPRPVRDAALLKSVRLGYDTLPPATVVARLKELSVPGNPWFGIAGEMTALAHLKAGQTAPAKPLLTAIARDPAMPPSLRGRTAELALALGVDQAALQTPLQRAELIAPAAPAK